MNELATFQRYNSLAEADEAAAALRAHGIETIIERDNSLLDQNIVGQRFDDPIQLKIKTAEFTRAMEILIDSYKMNLQDVPEDYMLHTFSNQELKDVIAKPDEWGPYNYNVALVLLKARNENEHADINTIVKDRNAQLSQPRELTPGWMLLGYGFSVIGIAAMIVGNATALWLLYALFYGLPGILGIILGLYIILIKRTLLDGTRMYSFSKPARRHGSYMVLLAVVPWMIVLYLRLR